MNMTTSERLAEINRILANLKESRIRLLNEKYLLMRMLHFRHGYSFTRLASLDGDAGDVTMVRLICNGFSTEVLALQGSCCGQCESLIPEGRLLYLTTTPAKTFCSASCRRTWLKEESI